MTNMKKRKEVALIDIFYRCWLLGILLVPPNPDVPIRVKTATPHDESWSWAKGFRIGDETPKSDDQIGLFDSFGAPVREAKRSALAYLARRFHTEHSVVYPLLLGHVNQYQRDGRFGHYTESPVVPNFEVPSTSSQRLEDDLSVEDGDLIDILWRQDIAIEKGYSFAPDATNLERQHEVDVNLLHEKAFVQNFQNSGIQPWEHRETAVGAEAQKLEDKTELEFERLTTDTSFASQLSEEDVMKDELIWRQFLTLSPYPTKTQEMMESGTDFEKGLDSLMDFDKALTTASEPGPPCDTYFRPLQDGMFDDRRANLNRMPSCEGAIQFNDVNLHPQNMSFCRPLQQQSAEVDETAAAVPITAEMEFLRTPSLDMTNADLASLFADRQIIDDIIESVGVQTVPISPVSNNLYDMNLTSTSNSFDPAMWESQNIFGFFQHPHDSQFIEYPSHHDSVGPSNLGRMRTESDSTLVSQDTSISNSTLQGSSVASGSAMSNYDEVGGAAGWSPCPSFSDATTHDHPYSSLFETGAEVEVIEEEDEDEGEESEGHKQHSAKSQREIKRGYKRGRDGELARQYRLPVDAAQICDMSTEEYSLLLKSPLLTREQLDVIRKIRRRGKNKLAARSSRQKKELSIAELQAEVQNLMDLREELSDRERAIDDAIQAERQSTARLLATAISRSGGESRVQVNPDDFDVYENANGELMITRKHK